VRGLGPQPIRLGLYFPLLGGWREWEGPRWRREALRALDQRRPNRL